MVQIHQLVPALHQGDAIGDSARAIRNYLRQHGYRSEIYAYQIDEGVAAEARNFHTSQPELSSSDILILHFALPSGMTDYLNHAGCKKALIHHNVTPSYFWLQYDPVLVGLASQARIHLQSLSNCADRSAGDSEYNRQELEQLGFRNTCVLPIFVPFERYQVEPSPFITSTIKDGLFNMLAVGRLAPNKKLEDVIRLYYFYKKLYNPLSRLILVGKTNVVPSYYSSLKELSSRYGLLPEDVVFAGHVDWPELVAYYQGANVYVSMSEHEGFCVPLVEAMICNTPVLAYASTAVPYTLGPAGIQFTEKDYPALAGLCHRLWTDEALRGSVLQEQQKQVQKYSKPNVEKAIDEFLTPLL